MIVDSSAIVAIVCGESDADRYIEALAGSPSSLMSAGTYLECGIVIDANGDPVLSRRLDELMEVAGVSIAPVTDHQARIARQAYRDFGKGSGHPARLNMGDCFAYALALDSGDTLLYKGSDFSETDISPALSVDRG